MARISYLTQDRQISSLRQCKYAVRWQNRQRLTRNGSREGISLGSREHSACSTGRRVVNLKRTRTQIGEATKSRRSVSAECKRWSDMRGGHCLKVWQSRVISLSTAERELHAAVNRARGIGNSERGGHCMWVEPTAGCQSDDVLGQPQRAGQGKTRRHAECVDTSEASKSKRCSSRRRWVRT